MMVDFAAGSTEGRDWLEVWDSFLGDLQTREPQALSPER